MPHRRATTHLQQRCLSYNIAQILSAGVWECWWIQHHVLHISESLGQEELLKSWCRWLVVQSWRCLSAAAVSHCSPQGCEITLLDTFFAVLEPCSAGAAHAYSKADNLITSLQKNICFFAGSLFWRKKWEPFKAVIIKLKSQIPFLHDGQITAKQDAMQAYNMKAGAEGLAVTCPRPALLLCCAWLS